MKNIIEVVVTKFTVTGMSCAACQARVEKAVSSVVGVESVSVSLLTNSMAVEGIASAEDIIRAVEKAGYGAAPEGAEVVENDEIPTLKRRLVLSAVFLLALMYTTMGHNMFGWPLPTNNLVTFAFVQMVLALAVMVINGKFFTSGFSALIRKSPNMDTLVALGSCASFGWSLFVLGKLFTAADPMALYMNELYFESAAMIPALITVGKLLEAISKGRTTDALKSLMKSAPKTAKVIREGAEREVPVSEVAVGDLFAVRAGDMIPVDGVVLEGSGGVDESSLTGESVPADKQVGDKVSAATINKSGFLKCRATRVGADTTFSQIVRMVSDAAATKAPIARIADKVSAIFVPTVIIIALVVIAGWLIAGQSAAFALARGISVLVISCPCALGLATPVAVMVGSGVGARNGILFKTGEALENTGKIAAAALDKTGTVTKGQPEVTDVLPAEGVSEAELAGKAAAAESMSDHPLAKAVSSWSEPMGEASFYKEIPGKGFESLAEGKTLRGGNGGYISDFAEIPYNIKEDAERLSAAGKTVLFFAEDDRFLGAMAVADTLKEDSAAAVGQLGKLGVDVIMLSGDNERTAKALAREAGIDEVIAGVLPEGKEEVIRALRKRGKVAMVGDGINDAPALTRADIGVAVGNGTDIAAESADVVLMGGGLSDLAAAVRLSRAALGNIRENLFWAFFYNALCIPLAAGLFPWKISPMICAAAMSLSSFSVCMNALRLNFFDIHDGRRDKPLRRKERKTTMEKTIKIKGMMCPHCEATVKKALEALAFVSEADVSHEKGTAVLALSGDFDENAVRKAVEDKDFTYIGVE